MTKPLRLETFGCETHLFRFLNALGRMEARGRLVCAACSIMRCSTSAETSEQPKAQAIRNQDQANIEKPQLYDLLDRSLRA